MTRPTPATAPRHGILSTYLRAAVGFVGLVTILGGCALLCIPLAPWRMARLRLGNRAGALAGRWAMAMAGITVRRVGRPLDSATPAIFVQNHGGSVDLWLAVSQCPSPGSGVVKRELLYVPVVGLAYWMSGHLMIDRGRSARSIRAMDRMSALIRQHGISLWILPEGTRSADGRLQPFKKGFAHMALQTRLPIVPVVVHGAHALWPRGLRITPGEIIVEALPPIATDDWTVDTLDAHIAGIEALFADRLRTDAPPPGAAHRQPSTRETR